MNHPQQESDTLFRLLIPAAVVIIVAFSVFSPTLSYDFLPGFDDNLYVTDNLEHLHLSGANLLRWWQEPVASSFHPLTMYSFMVDYALWGTEAFGYRLQSLFWHIIAVVGLYVLTLHIGRSRIVAIILTAAFALHPQRVESVVWISERKDVLCTAFYLWAMVMILRHRQRGRGTIPWRGFALFCLAILSKPMAVSFPLIAVMLEWRHLRRFDIGKISRMVWPYFLVIALWIPVTLWSQRQAISPEFSWSRQIRVAAVNIPWYTATYFFPAGSNPLYPRVELRAEEWQRSGAICTAILLSMVLLWRWNRSEFSQNWLPLALCYPCALAPAIGLIPVGAIDRADRYSYIPAALLTCFLAACGGLLVRRCRERSATVPAATSVRHGPRPLTAAVVPTLVVLYCIYIFNLGAMTTEYQRSWRDLQALMTWAFYVDKPSPVVIGTLGDLAMQRGDPWVTLGLAQSLADHRSDGLRPEHLAANQFKAGFLRAAALFQLGKTDRALLIFEELTRHDAVESLHQVVDFATLYALMADCYQAAGAYDKAIAAYSRSLQTQPGRYETHLNRGVSYFSLGQFAAAINDFRMAISIRPGDQVAMHNVDEATKRLTNDEPNRQLRPD